MPQSQMCNDLIGIRDNHGCRSYHTSASGKGCQYHFVHAIVINAKYSTLFIGSHSLVQWCCDQFPFTWNNFERLGASNHC